MNLLYAIMIIFSKEHEFKPQFRKAIEKVMEESKKPEGFICKKTLKAIVRKK
jgi:hypothetical protein